MELRGTDTESYRCLRVRMVAVGIYASYALGLAELLWLGLTWDHPHRLAAITIVSFGLVATAVLQRLDADRIVRSSHCNAFFLAWSLADIIIVTATASLDGGATSPAIAGLFCTAVFTALSYPLRSVALIGVLNVVGLLVAGAIGDADSQATEAAYLWMFSVCLAIIGAMCVWQSRVQEELRGELAWLSSADPLTGALNRRGFAERLDAALAAAARTGSRVSLLVLDLDRFKAVNDEQGHQAGDALLCELVGEALTAVRAQDAVGRLGGDEFAVLLTGSEPGAATQVAERIADSLPYGVGVSFGVAHLPEDGETAEALHHRADERLYAHKRGRRIPLTA